MRCLPLLFPVLVLLSSCDSLGGRDPCSVDSDCVNATCLDNGYCGVETGVDVTPPQDPDAGTPDVAGVDVSAPPDVQGVDVVALDAESIDVNQPDVVIPDTPDVTPQTPDAAIPTPLDVVPSDAL